MGMILSKRSAEKLRKTWIEFGFPFAERFVSNANGRGVNLGYSKDSLRAAEEFLLTSWKEGYVFPRSNELGSEF